jgi:hypothetical protein
VWVEKFPTEFAQGYCGSEASDFWGWGVAYSPKRKRNGADAQQPQANKQQTNNGSDQTNKVDHGVQI